MGIKRVKGRLNMDENGLQPTGFTFWPVGTGDSTTVKIDDNTFLQIDIRHMKKSEDDDEEAYPVIDHLITLLPIQNNKPYLSTFALTHPDLDHCQGFAQLLEQVTIGELWLSPRTFREYAEDLCDDAKAFQDEAMRRVDATIVAGGDPGAGSRVRIIGYDYLLQEDQYKGFPEEFFSVPGHEVSIIDGQDHAETFQAFIHAPFLEDSFGDRNDCSLAFQITLSNGINVAKALFFGDLTYPILKRIYEVSEPEDLEWNVLLAPHHCSKSAMYWKDEGAENECKKQDILDSLSNSALSPGYIVASSVAVPANNSPGDNPPHAKAKREYILIAPDEFLCTHENQSGDETLPVSFGLTECGFEYLSADDYEFLSLAEAINRAEGSNQTPAVAVGYGRSAE